MPEITLIVQHEVGLHARPASLFVQEASKFKSDITVTHGNRTVNAKSILTVLTLGVSKGAEITIQSEGEDAVESLAAIEELVNDNFGEGS
jgi:phosphotransferase system HPr (HPr) family protein